MAVSWRTWMASYNWSRSQGFNLLNQTSSEVYKCCFFLSWLYEIIILPCVWKSYSLSLNMEALTSMLMLKLLCSVFMKNEIKEYFIKWNDCYTSTQTRMCTWIDLLQVSLKDVGSYRDDHVDSVLFCTLSGKNTWERNTLKGTQCEMKIGLKNPKSQLGNSK